MQWQAAIEVHDKLLCCWHVAGDTRFYTAYISGVRLLKLESKVRQLVVDNEVVEWGRKTANKSAFKELKQLVNKNTMWRNLLKFCKLMKPIVKLLRLVDSDMPSLGKVKAIELRSAWNAALSQSDHAGNYPDWCGHCRIA